MNAKKRNLIIIIMIVLVIIIAILFIRKNKEEEIESIFDNDIEIEIISQEDRMNNAIEGVTQRLDRAGLSVTKLNTVSIDNIDGYKIQVEGQSLEVYYLERNKLVKIIKSGTINGEAELTLNGSTKKALIYGDIFILNCEDEDVKQKISSALNIR